MNGFPNQSDYCLKGKLHHNLVLICVQQLDIVKFALPLVKISFHPIFSVVGKHTNFFEASRAASQPYFDGVQQLDIVKFALPLVKISFHPIFSAVGKHTNFFMSGRAASRPFYYFTFSITSFAATSPVLTGATSA